MKNLPQILFTGFGAAIIAAIFYSLREISQKYLAKTKQLPYLAILTNEYLIALAVLLPLGLLTSSLNFNATTIAAGFINGLLLAFAVYLSLKAVAIEDFSLTLPFLALTPIFLIPVEFIFFKVLPTPLALWGIGAIVAGTFWLGLAESKDKKKFWRFSVGSQLMILVAFIYSLAGNIDKIGALNSNPLNYSIWVYFFIVLNYGIINYWQNRKNPQPINLCSVFKKHWLIFCLTGLILALANWLLMIAYSTILVNYAVSIKRAGFLLAVMLGPLIFKEKNLLKRLPGVLLMLGGAIIVIIFG